MVPTVSPAIAQRLYTEPIFFVGHVSFSFSSYSLPGIYSLFCLSWWSIGRSISFASVFFITCYGRKVLPFSTELHTVHTYNKLFIVHIHILYIVQWGRHYKCWKFLFLVRHATVVVTANLSVVRSPDSYPTFISNVTENLPRNSNSKLIPRYRPSRGTNFLQIPEFKTCVA